LASHKTSINKQHRFLQKIFFKDKFRNTSISLTNQQFLNASNEITQLISPKFIGLYIAEQMGKPINANNSFSKNLNFGIVNLAGKISNLTKSNILGLKISCSGK
tara:strand:+ start:345 stop:656 length:312 start_codon:yes stop_codon:yes gene_type:complete